LYFANVFIHMALDRPGAWWPNCSFPNTTRRWNSSPTWLPTPKPITHDLRRVLSRCLHVESQYVCFVLFAIIDVKTYLQVGYDSRDGYNYYLHDLDARDLVNSKNTDSTGRWMLQAQRSKGNEKSDNDICDAVCPWKPDDAQFNLGFNY